jgi:hypothetical protein
LQFAWAISLRVFLAFAPFLEFAPTTVEESAALNGKGSGTVDLCLRLVRQPTRRDE